MIVGIGLDLTDVGRVRDALRRHGERFRSRILNGDEDDEFLRRPESGRATHLAGRFAVKEAALKALGTGLRAGISWTDFVVSTDPRDGSPSLRLQGVARRVADERGIDRVHVTITHTHELAAAVVVLERDAGR